MIARDTMLENIKVELSNFGLTFLKRFGSNKEFYELDNDQFIDMAYKMILRRAPDHGGRSHFKRRLVSGEIHRNNLLEILIDSIEFRSNIMLHSLGNSLHESRQRFIHQLPKAKRIVDLGGSCQNSDAGALVLLGYPYSFEKLTIIDLPIDDRHEIYQNNREVRRVDTHLGPVEYLYQSMTQLQPIPDRSVDLVYSGQSIEHVTEDDAKSVFAEILRVLRPNGYFCLDTPNGRLTRIQQDAFIDPDHKVEYTHPQLSKSLLDSGFAICAANGMNYAGPITQRHEFIPSAIAKNVGLYHDIENCYLLSYICQKKTK